ncbi:hypothetical protein BaRGS_00024808 [Batillaria attramentaria]|uniref:ADP-ribosylation factor n=1 Tax=Batillaria attramentaria TaxID=370345 RepID=A0ABD0K9W8_9CAEN
MGQGLLSRLWGNKEVRILMNGLDAAGKTTMLYQMKLGEVVTTIPTIGFNVETVQYKNMAMTVWDVGGRGKIRPLYRHYYQNTDALMFIIDCGDRERLEDAVQELHKILQEEELAGIPVAILANKQDVPNAMMIDTVSVAIGVQDKLRERNVCVFATSGTTGEGLFEPLEWLSQQIAVRETKAAVVKPLERAVPSCMTRFSSSLSAAVKHSLGLFKGRVISSS